MAAAVVAEAVVAAELLVTALGMAEVLVDVRQRA